MSALPLGSGEPEDIRDDLEDNLLDCDGLVLMYGRIPRKWIREQLRLLRKLLPRREKPLKALQVFDAPPSEKPKLSMEFPGMKVVDCRDGLSEDPIRSLLQAVQT